MPSDGGIKNIKCSVMFPHPKEEGPEPEASEVPLVTLGGEQKRKPACRK